MAPTTSPPSLLEATQNSTTTWQVDLQSLFHHAKDRFPDVVWEVLSDDKEGKGTEDVWGHKAIVYARAPPSFQARYFSFRPPPIASPLPDSASPLPAQSTTSLGFDSTSISRSPSPLLLAAHSPAANSGTLLRLPTSINPALFSNELEYLYTGKGLGEAFEFLFDTSEIREEGNTDENRIDKLRKDLVFMWRSRLYSDVRIALTGTFSSTNHENTTAIFSSHRFILVSRSPYFYAQYLSWNGPSKSDQFTITLPSPPFTPASLHFTLGFIYTGTLVFSHRTYDLDTAFHIMRSSTYLSLDSLYDEIQARIVQEMMHGLFHAFLEFAEYERITGGKWGTGGCRCRQCARRAPRVLEFALSEDVKNPNLERGARRALVGLFGEGWCTSEFASLSQKLRDSLLKGLTKRTTPMNIFALLFAAQHAIEKLGSIIDAWADISREMVLAARKVVDDVLCAQCEECFEQPDWLEIMEADGAHFEDGERVGWIMESIIRGLNEKNAGIVYQTLVSSILLRPHLTETESTMISSTSHIRVQVEDTRVEVLRWMRKRWIGIRQVSGFDTLDGWALKEISGEIEVAVEDLLNPAPTSPKGSATKSGARPSLLKTDGDTDTASMHSLHKSVLNRNMAKQSSNTPVKSSASSIRSVARSTHSIASTAGPIRRSPAPPGLRPDSKLTPSTRTSTLEPEGSQPMKSDANPSNRTKSLASNAASIIKSRSFASSETSSIRSATKKGSAVGLSALRIPASLSRPTSGLSATSDGSTTFKTANSELHPNSVISRSRKTSGASTVSNTSVRTTGPSPSKPIRPRRTSAASTASTLSTSAKPKRSVIGKESPKVPGGSKKSTVSVRSITSVKKTLSTSKKDTLSKRDANDERISTISDKGKSKAPESTHVSNPSSGSNSTVKDLQRRGSTDTITKSPVGSTPLTSALSQQTSPLKESSLLSPRGATLDVGIPCIISSKRKRFRAYARYIGEVEGETGPWVGVEVPVGDRWPGDKLEGRDWNDGTWGGIRYFDIAGVGSDYGDDHSVRRRKLDHNHGKERSLKREGDQLSIDRNKRLRSASPAISDISNSESRGLFVRPQQVLYVVDAVGVDLY